MQFLRARKQGETPFFPAMSSEFDDSNKIWIGKEMLRSRRACRDL